MKHIVLRYLDFRGKYVVPYLMRIVKTIMESVRTKLMTKVQKGRLMENELV